MLSEGTYFPSGNYHPRLGSSRDLINCQWDELMFSSTFTHFFTDCRRHRENEKVREGWHKEEFKVFKCQAWSFLKYSELFFQDLFSGCLFKKSVVWNQQRSKCCTPPIFILAEYFYKWSLTTLNVPSGVMVKLLWRTWQGVTSQNKVRNRKKISGCPNIYHNANVFSYTL